MGLRELKKHKTRKLIADTACGLFVARGFSHVTVADVAEAAGVSEKTVFNYFPTKEDLFFDELPAIEAALVAAVREREPDESVLSALRRLQLSHCKRWSSREFAQWARVIEDSPALQAKELETMAHFAQALDETLREELGLDELEARVAASLLIAAQWQLFRLARERALAGKHGPTAERRLRADVERAYELVERGLGELG